MEYQEMSKELKQEYVDAFIEICSNHTELEICELYRTNKMFRKYHEVAQKYFVEFFVEPVVEMLKPFLEVVEKTKRELNEQYVRAIQSNPDILNKIGAFQTMSLGS